MLHHPLCNLVKITKKQIWVQPSSCICPIDRISSRKQLTVIKILKISENFNESIDQKTERIAVIIKIFFSSILNIIKPWLFTRYHSAWFRSIVWHQVKMTLVNFSSTIPMTTSTIALEWTWVFLLYSPISNKQISYFNTIIIWFESIH